MNGKHEVHMFTLKQIGPEVNESAPYEVIFFHECTVGEFVNTVIANTKEWGYIGIDDHQPWSYGTPNCEYRWGALISRLPDDVLSRTIKSARADSGWSRTDYRLVLK